MDNPIFGIPLERAPLTDLDFAGNIVLHRKTKVSLQEMTTSLHSEASKIGQCISTEKTKLLQITTAQDSMPIVAHSQTIQQVQQFTYLGSIVSTDGGTDKDINCLME